MLHVCIYVDGLHNEQKFRNRSIGGNTLGTCIFACLLLKTIGNDFDSIKFDRVN